MLLLKLLLEPVDLFLQNVDPLRELGRRQLLFLVIAGAERRAAAAAAGSRGVNLARTRRKTGETAASVLPDERVGVRRRRGYFGVRQILLALPVGVEARRYHGVAVFLQQLADQKAAGVRGRPRLLEVGVLPLQGRVRWHRLCWTKMDTFLPQKQNFSSPEAEKTKDNLAEGGYT